MNIERDIEHALDEFLHENETEQDRMIKIAKDLSLTKKSRRQLITYIKKNGFIKVGKLVSVRKADDFMAFWEQNQGRICYIELEKDLLTKIRVRYDE